MKKILLAILTITASTFFNAANAQWCGTVSSCIGSPTAQPGFPAPDSLPCVHQGVAYNSSVSFKMFSSFNYLGQHQLDSVTIDTIYNLPCGLCWSLNKASKTYAPNEIGCMSFHGTTNDVVGQYNLRLGVTAYLSSNPGVPVHIVNPNTVDAAGIKLWLRVAGSGGACVAVDTTQGATNQVASASCPSAINEVAANVASVNIMPNPISSTSVLSFVAEKNANYSVKITDITGKIISVKEIQANPGINTSTIERGMLSSGIYFLSLSDGQSSISKKFSVVE